MLASGAGGQGTVRPAFESLPRRKPRSGKGVGAARTDLWGFEDRRLSAPIGLGKPRLIELVPDLGIGMAGLWPLPESVLACRWR